MLEILMYAAGALIFYAVVSQSNVSWLVLGRAERQKRLDTATAHKVAAPQDRTLPREIDTIPFTTIDRLVHQSEVKVRGSVGRVDMPLTAPVSGRECAFYQLTIERFVPPDAMKRLWYHHQMVRSMWIEHGEGACRVALDRAHVVWEKMEGMALADGRIPASEVQRLEELSGQGRLAGAQYHEVAMAEDCQLTVVGVAKTEAGERPAQGGYRKSGGRMCIEARLIVIH